MNIAYWLLVATIALNTLFIAGCTSLYPPIRKASLLVTSPPNQAFLVCDAKDMTPQMVEMCMRINNNVAFKDYKFNENLNINISASGTASDTKSTTDTSSITVN